MKYPLKHVLNIGYIVTCLKQWCKAATTTQLLLLVKTFKCETHVIKAPAWRQSRHPSAVQDVYKEW
jgi:hypothetical protein